jgi:hypothetical protein
MRTTVLSPVAKESSAEIKRIKERIITLCAQGQQTGEPYFVAQLGRDLGKDVKLLGFLTGKGLSDFVRAELGDQLKIVTPPGRRVGADVIIKAGQSSTFAKATETELVEIPIPAASKSKTEPRYNHRFWSAFSTPLTPQKVRYIDRTTFALQDTSSKYSFNSSIG